MLALTLAACSTPKAASSPVDPAEAANNSATTESPKADGPAETADPQADPADAEYPKIDPKDPALDGAAIGEATPLANGTTLTIELRPQPDEKPTHAWEAHTSTPGQFTAVVPHPVYAYALEAGGRTNHVLTGADDEGNRVYVSCLSRADGPVPEADFDAEMVAVMMEAGGEIAKQDIADGRAYELVNDAGVHLMSWWRKGRICSVRIEHADPQKLFDQARLIEIFDGFSDERE